MGVTLEFHGQGVAEHAVVVGIEGDKAPAVSIGQTILRVDPRYFRPTEVETLLGDPTKAKNELGWVPEISAQTMCEEMITHDLTRARQHALLKQHGFVPNVSVE